MKTHGFTLIETLVAVTILTLSISAPLYAAGRALSVARNAGNELTASYLAQEGIEYVRLMRDNQYLINGTTLGWTKFKTGTIGIDKYTMGYCKRNSSTPSLSKVCVLDPSLDPSVGGTGQNGAMYAQFTVDPNNVPNNLPANIPTVTIAGSPSLFTRIIQETDISANEEKITSVVTWVYRGTRYTITSIDHLTPWQ